MSLLKALKTAQSMTFQHYPKLLTLAISNTQKMGIISPHLKLEDSFIFSSILSDGSVTPLLTPLRLLLGTSVFACQAQTHLPFVTCLSLQTVSEVIGMQGVCMLKDFHEFILKRGTFFKTKKSLFPVFSPLLLTFPIKPGQVQIFQDTELKKTVITRVP